MVPVDRVGLYVPGGLAPLVSSVRDERRARPGRGRRVDRAVLARRRRTTAACRTRRSWPRARCSASTRCTPSAAPRRSRCSPTAPGPAAAVDLVTGPGNIYTVAAKRLLKGVVGIDSEAGPTEIAVLADDTADAAYVAADLISQAEHDPLAASVLVTASRAARRRRRGRARQAGLTRPATPSGSAPRWPASSPAIVLVDDLEQGLDVVNAYAAEHLEIQTADAAARAPPGSATPARSSSAPFAPVSLGDYCAGSNHVLPTGGCACHSSGLSVRAFLKSVHVVDYARDALAEVADHVVTLAEAEDLPGHGAAVRVRFDELAMTFPPAARGAARPRAVRRARSSTCPSSSTSTRTPTRPSPAVRGRHRGGGGGGRGARLNRYPDREFTELRDGAGGVPQHATAAAASRRTRCGRPTAPTR